MAKNGRKHYNKINRKNFKQLKALLTAGIPYTQITQLTGRTYIVLKGIEESKNFKTYKATLKERSERYRKPAELTVASSFKDIKSIETKREFDKVFLALVALEKRVLG